MAAEHRTCARCNAALPNDSDTCGTPLSNGLCSACRAEAERSLAGVTQAEGGRGCADAVPVQLRELLDRFEAPVLVVNSAGAIIGANGVALMMLGKEHRDIVGRLGGVVLECVHASEPGGCGRTLHCDGCGIRQTVMTTLRSGQATALAQAVTVQQKGGVTTTQAWLITTERLGDAVLVRLQPAARPVRELAPGVHL
jgi:PAS domain-containing protein